MKEENEKVGLKFSIQKTKIMASGPITSWQIDGETMETHFIFLGSKIIAHGDCSHEIKTCLEIKRCLPLGRASLIAQLVKFPPAMWEAPVQFLGWENPLEKG